MNLNFNTEDNTWRLDPKTGFLVVTACIIKSGVFEYEEHGALLLPNEEVINSFDNISKMQLTIGHNNVNIFNEKEKSKGYILGDTLKINKLNDNVSIWGDLFITDIELVKEIVSKSPENQRILLSAGYHCNISKESGEYQGDLYEGIQNNLQYNHLAIINEDLINKGVENRMGEQVRIYNSKEEEGEMLKNETTEDQEKQSKEDDETIVNNAEDGEEEKQGKEEITQEDYKKQNEDLTASNEMLKNQMQEKDDYLNKIQKLHMNTIEQIEAMAKKLEMLENQTKEITLENSRIKDDHTYNEAVMLLNSFGIDSQINKAECIKLQAVNCIRKQKGMMELSIKDDKVINTIYNDFMHEIRNSKPSIDRFISHEDCRITNLNNSTFRQVTALDVNQKACEAFGKLAEKHNIKK